MIDFKKFISDIIKRFKCERSDLFDISNDIKETEDGYTWAKAQTIQGKVDFDNIKSILKDESFDSAMDYIDDIEKGINEIEFESCDPDTLCKMDEIKQSIRFLRMELKDDEDFDDTTDEIDKQEDNYDDVKSLMYEMDDIIIEHKNHISELESVIIDIMHNAINNDGKIEVFDYIYIESEKRAEFDSIWKSTIRKDKINKLILDLEIDGESVKIEKEIENGKE